MTLIDKGITKTVLLTDDKEIDEFLKECFETLRLKGRDYTIGSEDRLHNFRTVGDFTGVGMLATWGVYFYKHVSALFSYIKSGGQNESEPIEWRIKDCVVYLLLFYKMVKEKQRERESEKEILF